MTQKYAAFDKKLLEWLNWNRTGVTTALANQAIGANTATLQRHVSRRFTQLEDAAVLKCVLEGTTRVCTVVKDPPSTLSKKRWRPGSAPGSQKPLPSTPSSIPATDSDAFLAAGGKIEQLPTQWGQRPSCNAVGLVSIDHVLASME